VPRRVAFAVRRGGADAGLDRIAIYIIPYFVWRCRQSGIRTQTGCISLLL
jgi:hypothetical protein